MPEWLSGFDSFCYEGLVVRVVSGSSRCAVGFTVHVCHVEKQPGVSDFLQDALILGDLQEVILGKSAPFGHGAQANV